MMLEHDHVPKTTSAITVDQHVSRAARLALVLLPAILFVASACGGDDRASAGSSDAEPLTENSASPSASLPQTVGSIERLHPGLDALLPESTVLEVVASGFDWSEGPVWVPDPADSGFLLFSDVPGNVIHSWSASRGLATWLTPSGYTGDVPRGAELGSNGLMLDADGRLLVAQHGDRRIARLLGSLTEDGPGPGSAELFETVAEQFNGRRFNSPNDLIVGADGTVWFTDPPYGLEQGPDDPARELEFQGVYARTPDGSVELVTDRLTRPNGVALSPDGKHLYITNSDPEAALWWRVERDVEGRFTVDPDAPDPVWFDATDRVADFPGLPDGLDVDSSGNVWSTGPGGVLVIAPDGNHLGTLLTERPTGNCTFGEDGSTLFITADDVLIRVRTNARGTRFTDSAP